MKVAEIPVNDKIVIEIIADNTYLIADNVVEYKIETEEIDISKIDSSKLLESGWNMPNDVEFACSQ